VPAYWLFPTAAKFSGCGMDFRSASKKRKPQLHGTGTCPLTATTWPVESTPKVTCSQNPDACAAFFEALHKALPKTAVLSLTDKFSAVSFRRLSLASSPMI